ncbi:MAG: hypothetical protein GX306_07765 [Clostridiales bacterium]|nr:hypothetical protein [Clostridiales bacterium]
MFKLNRRQKRNWNLEGLITVFMSLILLLVLSLIFTIIEGARVSTAKVYAERALYTAMDSVLAKYYEPLWREYHIFALNTSTDKDTFREGEVLIKLEEYMNHNLHPDQGMVSTSLGKALELYKITIDSLAVTDQVMLTDYDGELFLNEAIEYMKYRKVGDAVELLLDKMSLLEKPGKVSYIYEEKLKVEEELVEIDRGILRLMELLDGVKTSKKGLVINKKGKIETVPYFIKKISNKEVISRETVGINNEAIFLEVMNLYIYPNELFEIIDKGILELKNVNHSIDQTEEDCDRVNSKLAQLKEKRASITEGDELTEEEKSKYDDLTEQINQCRDDKKALERKRKELKSQKGELIDTIHSKKEELTLLMDQLLPLIHEAKEVIKQIIRKVEIAQPLLEEYEQLLDRAKGELKEDIYHALIEGLENLKKYTSKEGLGYDFNHMKKILDDNQSILSEMKTALIKATGDLSDNNLDRSRTNFQVAKEILRAYQIDGLTLDYGSFVFADNQALGLMDTIISNLLGGITGLVIDPEVISKKELAEGIKPSEMEALSVEEEGFIDKLTNLFKECNLGSSNLAIGGIFGSMVEEIGTSIDLKEGIKILSELILYQEYIKEHFYSYPEGGQVLHARKPTALDYEQEYLLNGKKSDKDNLELLIGRIIAIRMAADLIPILTNKTICNEAKAAATVIVGFTGLPILISITQTLILILWSFAEALVDTCALLMGKELAVIKKDITMKLPDLLLLNREMIENKAKSLHESDGITMSYHNYLTMFILLKNRRDLIYRSMDLIQENLRIRYEDNFSLLHCMFGFKTEVGFYMKPKFIAFKFVQEHLDYEVKNFHFYTEAEYCY